MLQVAVAIFFHLFLFTVYMCVEMCVCVCVGMSRVLFAAVSSGSDINGGTCTLHIRIVTTPAWSEERSKYREMLISQIA